MSFFRRITLAVSTRLERVVGEIENHDAVVEAGIRESRRLHAKARVRHEGLRRDGERLRLRVEGLRGDAQRWRERALATAAEPAGEEKALACLSRAKRAASEAETLAETARRQAEVEHRLGREIEGLRRRIEDLEQRRRLMRTREATAEAATRIRASDDGTLVDLEDTFERWEIRLAESEPISGDLGESDALEAEFVVAEERAALQHELAALQRDRAERSGGTR